MFGLTCNQAVTHQAESTSKLLSSNKKQQVLNAYLSVCASLTVFKHIRHEGANLLHNVFAYACVSCNIKQQVWEYCSVVIVFATKGLSDSAALCNKVE